MPAIQQALVHGVTMHMCTVDFDREHSQPLDLKVETTFCARLHGLQGWLTCCENGTCTRAIVHARTLTYNDIITVNTVNTVHEGLFH